MPPDAAHHLHHPLSPLALAQSQKTIPQQKETLVRLHTAGVEAVHRVAAQKRRKCLEKRLRVEATQKQDERVYCCKAGVQRVGCLEARVFFLCLSRVGKAHTPLARAEEAGKGLPQKVPRILEGRGLLWRLGVFWQRKGLNGENGKECEDERREERGEGLRRVQIGAHRMDTVLQLFRVRASHGVHHAIEEENGFCLIIQTFL